MDLTPRLLTGQKGDVRVEVTRITECPKRSLGYGRVWLWDSGDGRKRTAKEVSCRVVTSHVVLRERDEGIGEIDIDDGDCGDAIPSHLDPLTLTLT